jgi:pimeloyl-ACP methyl ester carboxylesterase
MLRGEQHMPISSKYTALCLLLAAVTGCAQVPMDSGRNPDIALNEYYVPVVSRVPSMTGAVSQLYVRERVSPSVTMRDDLEGQVVLFVHGAGTPAEVAFDVPVPGYSWMEYLAARGMDTFAMDMTGYGRSYRPPVMNDRCNLSAQQQEQLFGDACPPSYAWALTSMDSDWDDIDAVVDYIRELRGVERVHLVGWSQGGPRTGGYAARHTDKVANIVQLAPAYRGDVPAELSMLDLSGAAITKQSRDDFFANWDRQVGCDNQYDMAVGETIWADMLASDPVGATWGTGVRRAPSAATFGWGRDVVAASTSPLLMVAGTHDGQVNPQLVKNLYNDYGGPKLYLEMACSSHNAMWESDAQQLFEATYQWLNTTAYEGMIGGMQVLE